MIGHIYSILECSHLAPKLQIPSMFPLLEMYISSSDLSSKLLTPTPVLFLTLPFCTSNRHLHGNISNNELLIFSSQISSAHILAHPQLMATPASSYSGLKSQVVLDCSISAQLTSNPSRNPVSSTFKVIKNVPAFSLPLPPSLTWTTVTAPQLASQGLPIATAVSSQHSSQRKPLKIDRSGPSFAPNHTMPSPNTQSKT